MAAVYKDDVIEATLSQRKERPRQDTFYVQEETFCLAAKRALSFCQSLTLHLNRS